MQLGARKRINKSTILITKDIIAELESLIRKLKEDLAACTDEKVTLANELKACQANHGDSSGKIKELETALKACNEDREKIKADAEEAAELAAERDKQQAAAHALAIDDYKRQLDDLRKKLEEASTISVEASKASAIASAESSKLAYESILLLTGGSASDSAKKADSLDGFTPEPAK